MGRMGCHVIFSVEGDVPSALTSLGYLLGAVARDGDNAVIRIFATKDDDLIYVDFRI